MCVVDIESSFVVLRIEPKWFFELKHHLEERIVLEESFGRSDAVAVDADVDVAQELRRNRADDRIEGVNAFPQSISL